MILKIIDTINMNDDESVYQLHLDPSIIDMTPLEYDEAFYGRMHNNIHKRDVSDMCFSEVFDQCGYVYAQMDTVVLYLDTKNLYKFYDNGLLVDEYIDEIKECVTLFMREHNLNILT